MVCKLGSTGIKFDDIPNKDAVQGGIASNHNGLNWTNRYYLSAEAHKGTGYTIIRSFSEDVAFSVPIWQYKH